MLLCTLWTYNTLSVNHCRSTSTLQDAYCVYCAAVVSSVWNNFPSSSSMQLRACPSSFPTQFLSFHLKWNSFWNLQACWELYWGFSPPSTASLKLPQHTGNSLNLIKYPDLESDRKKKNTSQLQIKRINVKNLTPVKREQTFSMAGIFYFYLCLDEIGHDRINSHHH